jgi:nicotinate-nucleotide pyrophosphorylase (carboxylating)
VDDKFRLIFRIVQLALDEDQVQEDVTTLSLEEFDRDITAEVTAKETGVISGTRIFSEVYRHLDPTMRVTILAADGEKVQAGRVVMRLEGRESVVLKGERTALNFLQGLSGVATTTAAYVRCLKGLPVKILDTRKTTPGLRILQKEAVVHGGGHNHRLDLREMSMVKDNHIRMAGSIQKAVECIRLKNPRVAIEVETRNLRELREALDCGVKWIMLDNFPEADLSKAVAMKSGQTKYEISGNVTLDNIRQKACTGVDFISVGALTHSYKALDFSLNIRE